MITRPDPAQILDGVRAELRDRIAPELQTDTAKVALEMVDSVLANIGVRALHELAWMREEGDAAVAAASARLDRFPPAHRDAVAAALAAHAAGRAASLHYGDVQAEYVLASEVLSCCLEGAVASGDAELRGVFDALLHQRLDHEVEIMGDWGFVGRG